MEKGNENKDRIPVLRFSKFQQYKSWDKTTIDSIIECENSQLMLSKLNLSDKGYPIYGADGIIGYIPHYNKAHIYVSIVKDGSGVGRLNLCQAYSSLLGTLNYLSSKDETAYQTQWIYYLLQTINFSIYIKGSGIPHIYFNDYKNHIVYVPNPEEQQKIIDCFSSLDDLIEATTQKVEALKEHKRGLMQRLFPAEGKDVPDLRFPEFLINATWDIVSFAKYIKLFRGSSPRPIKEYLTDAADGINWIKIGDTQYAKGFVLSEVQEKITKRGAEKSRYVHKGELVLANSMSFGKTYLLAIDGCIYDGWFVLRGYEEAYYKPFLLQILNSDYVQNQYKKLSAGGIVLNISSEIVYQTHIFHTSIQEQKKIANCLSSLDELIEATSRKVEILKDHKKGLMQQLFPKI